MEYTRLKDIDLKAQIGQRVFISFLLKNKSIREQKDGIHKFAAFEMVDKDKVVGAKMFGISEDVASTLQDGNTYNSAVDIKPYDKEPCGYSCIIYNIEDSTLPATMFADWADNLPESSAIINNTIQEIANTTYGKIAYPILINNWERFSKWSAASGQHHTQLGGLLTHTAEVVTLCNILSDYINKIYGDTFINKPLLLSAALLHDIGKCNELITDTTTGKTSYSTYASLSTHIMDILTDVDLEAYELKIGQQDTSEGSVPKSTEQLFTEIEALKLLKHCLASHHGKLEWGSPIVPSIPEAEILHQMDLLDAYMYKYNSKLKDVDTGESITDWKNGISVMYKDSTKT